MTVSGKWNVPGIPHKGWKCADVIDVRRDEEAESDANYETCQMCGNEKIRFVHVMEHDEVEEAYRVGCVCAEKMSDDYFGPRLRETRLRKRAARRTNWLRRKWRISAKGNPFLNLDGHNVGIHQNKAGTWGYRIDSRFSTATFADAKTAKLALFDEFWDMTQGEEAVWSEA